MNKIAKEIKSYIGSAQLTDEEFLEHYGMPRRSGRYPWGSGKDDYQHAIDFLGRIEKLRDKEGLNNTEIDRKMGINESSVRSLLNEESKAKMLQARNTAEFLKEQLKTKKMIDVGVDTEIDLNVSREK